jgi:beta-N-acetylhexosaminidase
MSKSWTLREKIGQMLLIGFRGCQIAGTEPIARDIAERNIGGVVLFDEEMAGPSSSAGRNIQSPEQVAALTGALRKLAPTPLWIAIDQEGGRVNRLKPKYGFPETISHEELGMFNDPKKTFAHAEEIALTLVKAGINLNLAPVVDVIGNKNPIIKGKSRSFSSDPEIVARHAREFCRAHRKHGVGTCAKHFPGHGSARADTHLNMVDTTRDWTEQELIPFQRLIEWKECDCIMTAHIFNTRLDPERPATLSQAILQGILRRRMGFKGVLLSDDMEMQAISRYYGLEQSVQLGIEAGLDVLCFGNNMKFDANIGEKVFKLIERLVESGKIPEARIEESFQRIQNLKQRAAEA